MIFAVQYLYLTAPQTLVALGKNEVAMYLAPQKNLS